MSARVKIELLECRRMMSNTGNESVLIGNTLYFDYFGDEGDELWKSNPDGSNPTLVKDIYYPGLGSSYPEWFTEYKGIAYFTADDGSHGRELWRSDGTAAGTTMVANINTSTLSGLMSSDPQDLMVFDDKLFFIAKPTTGGPQLYAYDGLSAPVALKSAQPGINLADFGNLVGLNGLLYFTTRSRNPGLVTGFELGRTDGTPEGTLFLGDLYPGENANPTNLAALNDGHVIFQATTAQGLELFGTDGTLEGTVNLSNTVPGTIEHVEVDQGIAHFETRASGNDQYTHWVTDGTLAGTNVDPAYRVWSVNGTAGNDVVSISSDGGTTTVTINGQTYTRNETDFDAIEFHLGNGNDSLSVAANYVKSLAVYGEDGNDTLSGGDGEDTIVGGDGDDVILADGLGNDTYIGGAGADRIDYSARLTPIKTIPTAEAKIYIDGGNGETDRLDGFESFVSGQGDDSLSFDFQVSIGTENNLTLIDGSGGDDTIQFWADVPSGVIVHGGDGNDSILVGNSEILYIIAPPTADYENSWHPITIYGDAGNDTLEGGTGSNFYGGDGNDTVSYPTAKYAVWYYDTTHKRWMENYIDPIYAHASLDNFTNDGIEGHDNVHSDVEVVLGYQGAVIASGDGILPSSPPVSFPPASPPPPAVDSDPGQSPPAITGTSPADHILRIEGSVGAVSDRIAVRRNASDPDVLEVVFKGSVTADYNLADIHGIYIDGGSGHDCISVKGLSIPATILGGYGNDMIVGGSANDSIVGGKGDDSICGGAGDDWISASQGNDSVYGGAGNDFIRGDDGNDSLWGQDGVDSIRGGAGTDYIRGGEGIDRLIALAGSDDLKSNKGDTIVNDVLG